MSDIDLSKDALQKRREIAEKATQGTWITGEYRHDPAWVCLQENDFVLAQCQYRVNGENNAAHIALNSPDAVIAMIDEIEKLRSEKSELERIARWLADNINLCPLDWRCNDVGKNKCAQCWLDAAKDVGAKK